MGRWKNTVEKIFMAKNRYNQTENPDNFYKSREWLKARFRVLHRDKYQCVMCGACVKAKGTARVDHIKPRKVYPELSLDLENLRTLCASCDNKRHREKGYKISETPQVNFDGSPAGWWNK